MLIIFDLDDTLIDTTGSIFPYRIRQCLRCFFSENAVDFSKHYQELLLQKASSTIGEILSFAEKQRLDPTAALKELQAPLPENFPIQTTPFAKEILAHFAQKSLLALVTGGTPVLQWDKLEKAGIDSAIFSKIDIPEDSVKRPYYEALCQEFSIHPSDVWVCGDRVQVDLVPAYELGFHTVHMRWGRGKKVETPSWVEASIRTLQELKEIIR